MGLAGIPHSCISVICSAMDTYLVGAREKWWHHWWGPLFSWTGTFKDIGWRCGCHFVATWGKPAWKQSCRRRHRIERWRETSSRMIPSKRPQEALPKGHFHPWTPLAPEPTILMPDRVEFSGTWNKKVLTETLTYILLAYKISKWVLEPSRLLSSQYPTFHLLS